MPVGGTRYGRRMRYGFVVTGSDPNLAVELAPLIEQHGWDAMFVWEGIWATDPWSVLAAAAMRTERIRLGTMLTPLPRRRPWELASQTATVDALSGGRTVLSVGLGVPAEVEERFWIFEEDPGRRTRAELLDEGLELLDHLWRGEPFDYDGRHYRAARTETMLPAPTVQRPRIPTWVVGAWPRMKSMRRVARHDGWIPNYAPPGASVAGPEQQAATYTPEIAAEAIAWLREERERLGLADAAIVRPWADAGATWWLEADWSVPEERVADAARARIAAGPPRG